MSHNIAFHAKTCRELFDFILQWLFMESNQYIIQIILSQCRIRKQRTCLTNILISLIRTMSNQSKLKKQLRRRCSPIVSPTRWLKQIKDSNLLLRNRYLLLLYFLVGNISFHLHHRLALKVKWTLPLHLRLQLILRTIKPKLRILKAALNSTNSHRVLKGKEKIVFMSRIFPSTITKHKS